MYYACNMTAEICHQCPEYGCEWKPEEIGVIRPNPLQTSY